MTKVARDRNARCQAHLQRHRERRRQVVGQIQGFAPGEGTAHLQSPPERDERVRGGQDDRVGQDRAVHADGDVGMELLLRQGIQILSSGGRERDVHGPVRTFVRRARRRDLVVSHLRGSEEQPLARESRARTRREQRGTGLCVGRGRRAPALRLATDRGGCSSSWASLCGDRPAVQPPKADTASRSRSRPGFPTWLLRSPAGLYGGAAHSTGRSSKRACAIAP